LNVGYWPLAKLRPTFGVDRAIERLGHWEKSNAHSEHIDCSNGRTHVEFDLYRNASGYKSWGVTSISSTADTTEFFTAKKKYKKYWHCPPGQAKKFRC
jgi:hypothetical protein